MHRIRSVLVGAVLAAGCRHTPARAPSAPTPVTAAASPATPPAPPLPTTNSVGVWMQVVYKGGWSGETTVSIFGDGTIVRHSSRSEVLKKYVRREVMDRIRSTAEQAGLWTVKPFTCDCGGPLFSSDGNDTTYRSFEPGRVIQLEYRDGCDTCPQELRDLSARIEALIGQGGWRDLEGQAVDLTPPSPGEQKH